MGKHYSDSQIVTIWLNKGLVRKLDLLAKHGYAKRSAVIRQALAVFVNDPANARIASPDKAVTAQEYEYIKDDYPYMNPRDAEGGR